MSEAKTQSTGNDLVRFLGEQIERNKKATKRTWIIGLAFVLFIAAYMAGLVYLVRGILDPMTAARMVGQSIEATLPAVLHETENALARQATPLANALSAQIMAAMPKVREEAEKQVDRAWQEWLPQLRDEMLATVKSYVQAHKADLEDLYVTQKAPGFAEAFVNALVEEATVSLNRKLKETDGRDLQYVRKASLDAIDEINQELARLLNTPAEKMTRSDRLQRRLIVSWTLAVDEALRRQREGKADMGRSLLDAK